jgi:two-component system sensor histidine kinase QseC
MKFANSLRLRLLAGTLAIVATFWLTLSAVAWHEAMDETTKLLDDNLAQAGQLLAAIAGHESHEMKPDMPKPMYHGAVAFQIWEDGKRLSLRSHSAPKTRLSPVEIGFSDQGDWRVYSLWDDEEGNLVQVAESHQARAELSEGIAAHLLIPIAVALPLLAIALVLTVRSTLAPLSSLADSIGHRSPEYLDHIPVGDAPSEMLPILDQLNSLLLRVGTSLTQERRFTADAAHELRTPLAAMRTHAQVARASQTCGERDAALANVVAATDRAAHLIEQLLTLARLDAASLVRQFRPCDLHALAADVLAQETATAVNKSVDIELAEGPPVQIVSEPTLLAVLLRNLVDNAIRYTPPGGKVKVVATPSGGGATLEVIDNGPGIAAEDRGRVLDRFYRLAGSRETGSGLGLAIVARISELIGARLELTDTPDRIGLRVRVSFDGGAPMSLFPGDRQDNRPDFLPGPCARAG